ncbi:MAG: DUF3108 domain-containing protein [Proteobacteria bacterium]|nr:DUF3108 domain-containing protein [Pseudomonadota bacterium]
MPSLLRFFHIRHAVLTTLFIFGNALAASDHPAIKRAFQLPPSADLHYLIKAKQSGIMLDGNALMKWQASDGKFMLDTETRAMLLGKILETHTEGNIDDYGLAPVSSNEKRLRRDATSVSFDRAAKTLRFSDAAATYPLNGGEQDRNSIVWQLVANARGASKKFTAGSQWQYFVAGMHDAEAWTFKVGKTEKIESSLGLLHAVRVTRTQPAGDNKQQIDIWLAPALDWYPVRVRQTEPNGDYIEQTLDSVSKK